VGPRAMKVDSPLRIRSDAPILVKMVSTGEIVIPAHGAIAPHCASTTAAQAARRRVLFPPMFGPVRSTARGLSPAWLPRRRSFGITEEPPAPETPPATAHGCQRPSISRMALRAAKRS
jgi:hypothetical protein